MSRTNSGKLERERKREMICKVLINKLWWIYFLQFQSNKSKFFHGVSKNLPPKVFSLEENHQIEQHQQQTTNNNKSSQYLTVRAVRRRRAAGFMSSLWERQRGTGPALSSHSTLHGVRLKGSRQHGTMYWLSVFIIYWHFAVTCCSVLEIVWFAQEEKNLGLN